MNWDSQLSHIISAADGSVAKIRERLAVPSRLSREREDVYPVRELSHALDPPVHLSGAVQWTDLAAVQAQLQNQRQTIESLTQNLKSVERERDAQHRQIQRLEEEVRRLREGLEDQEKEKHRKQDFEGDKIPSVELRLEQWKREVGCELNNLRGHIDKSTSLGNQEESFSSKMCREELEELREEVGLLKSKLMRHEKDMYKQQSEAREVRRQCEHSYKTLESITDSHRTQGFELTRIISQYQNTQQDLRDLRLTVSGLKDEVRGLMLRDRLYTPTELLLKSKAAVAVETSPQRRLLADSEDELSPTPSLGDVSSDDLDTSWLGETEPKLRSQRRVARLSESDLSDTPSGLGSKHSDDIHDSVDGASGSSPDLRLYDL